MALAALDIEQVKTIVIEIVTDMWKERQNVVSTASSPDENNHKLELLERIIRVEEELKYLRKDMQQSREDMKQLREDTNRRFAGQREDTKQQREDMRQLREDMNRQLKIVLWVVSGWGGLIGLLVTASTLYS